MGQIFASMGEASN